MSSSIPSLIDTPANQRAAALEAWLRAQPDAAGAARELAGALAGMESTPFRAEGSNATTALIYWLEGPGIRHPLDEAAEATGDPAIAAQLWAHASTSALVLGELADLPYAYSKRAILTGSELPMVWEAFKNSLYDYPTGFLEDFEDWKQQAASGSLPLKVVTRSVAVAQQCARAWQEDDRRHLARLTD